MRAACLRSLEAPPRYNNFFSSASLGDLCGFAINLVTASALRAASPYRDREPTSHSQLRLRHSAATNPQSTKPTTKGINAETAVHFQLRVSL